MEQLRRDRTILLRHVVEIRTEKRKVKGNGRIYHHIYENMDVAQLNDVQPCNVDQDGHIDYALLTEQFANDSEVIELLPLVVIQKKSYVLDGNVSGQHHYKSVNGI